MFEPGTRDIKVILGKRKYSIQMTVTGSHIEFKSGFNKKWIKEVKESFSEPHWCGMDKPPRKSVWRVANTPRTRFRLRFLTGQNPYHTYDKSLSGWESSRPLYDHQKEMAAHWYDRHYCIFACEMGTGKTLAAFEVVERLLKEQQLINPWKNVWYVGPKTGVNAVQREIKKWDFDFCPRTFTYNKLTKTLKNWTGDLPTPRILIIDECSKVKTPTSQRSQAVEHLTRAIIDEWGDKGYVVEMSGTPAPKDPSDWWMPTEIACPGFMREGSRQKFKNRLCIIESRESVTGGVYPHIVTWLDDADKCKLCGELPGHNNHQSFLLDPLSGQQMVNSNYHAHEPSCNEVARLYKRMKGLVLVKFKDDCLDLPEKQYQIINVKPNAQTLRTLKLINQTSPRAITALIRARTLSDGFQYTEEKAGDEACELCHGAGETTIFTPDGEEVMGQCPNCGGKGETPVYKRSRDDCYSPKDDALIDLLEDQFEQYGRAVVWAGFSGSIDKLLELCKKHKWATLRYDAKVQGRNADGQDVSADELLTAMDASHPKAKALLAKYPKVAFIGNPRAGGMALTLTASPGAIYYSNDFSGEARAQSEDRVHRAGMDKNRSCTIYDLIHLPTDQLVLDNLKKKKNLQAMTMGQIQGHIERTTNR